MAQVSELEQLRKKQARKIHDLKTEVDSTQHTSQEGRIVADNAVQALSGELRTTKAALIAIQNREKAVCKISFSFPFKIMKVNPCPAEPGYTLPLQIMKIQISWLLKKPTDLDLHCFLLSI